MAGNSPQTRTIITPLESIIIEDVKTYDLESLVSMPHNILDDIADKLSISTRLSEVIKVFNNNGLIVGPYIDLLTNPDFYFLVDCHLLNNYLGDNLLGLEGETRLQTIKNILNLDMSDTNNQTFIQDLKDRCSEMPIDYSTLGNIYAQLNTDMNLLGISDESDEQALLYGALNEHDIWPFVSGKYDSRRVNLLLNNTHPITKRTLKDTNFYARILSSAIENKDVSAINKILEISKIDNDKKIVLDVYISEAAYTGDIEILKLIENAGGELYHAIESPGSIEVLNYLDESGVFDRIPADIDGSMFMGKYIEGFDYMIKTDNLQLFNYMLSYWDKIERLTNEAFFIHYMFNWMIAKIIENGSLDFIKLLIDRNLLDINDQNHYMLEDAINSDKTDIIDFLLNSGYPLDKHTEVDDYVENEPAPEEHITIAMKKGNMDLVQKLVKAILKETKKNASKN